MDVYDEKRRLGINKREKIMIDLVKDLRQFIDREARSCSMDYGCITPIYVYRMWGGKFSIEEIENGLTEIRKQGFLR